MALPYTARVIKSGIFDEKSNTPLGSCCLFHPIMELYSNCISQLCNCAIAKLENGAIPESAGGHSTPCQVTLTPTPTARRRSRPAGLPGPLRVSFLGGEARDGPSRFVLLDIRESRPEGHCGAMAGRGLLFIVIASGTVHAAIRLQVGSALGTGHFSRLGLEITAAGLSAWRSFALTTVYRRLLTPLLGVPAA